MPQTNTADLLALLQARGLFLAVAESLTGGALAAEIVSVPGASNVFLGSITAYQNSIKNNLLAVPADVLEFHGAVSAESAEAMAAGVRDYFAKAAGLGVEQVIGIATTGVAGPDTDGDKPIGLVYLGFSLPERGNSSIELHLTGDRSEIRAAAVQSALSELGEQIAD